MHIEDFQKEKVKERLLKNAAEIWGYQPSEMEGFDPIVDLLFGACAVEFEKISQEISNSQARSLEKLANLMVPEVLSLPVPAHTVIHARPSEPTYQLNQSDQFYFEKDQVNKDDPFNSIKKTIYFSPVHATRIFDGQINYVAKGNTIYRCDNLLKKNKVAVSSTGKHLDAHEVWLGIQLSDRIDSLKGLSFYFDWKSSSQKSHYQKLMGLSSWYLDDQELKIRHGFENSRSVSDNNEYFDFLNTGNNFTLDEKARRFYHAAFNTIESPRENYRDHLVKYPPSFQEVFEDEQLESEAEHLWIKIRFPQSMSADFILHGLFAMNCFPVVNRRLHSSGRPYSMEKEVNTIPLKTDDMFLSVKKVHNKEGKIYRQINLDKDNLTNLNTYSLRSGAVGRFDERNATIMLNHALELMRDECVAFKAWDDRMLAADIREMKQIIARLEQAIYKKSKTQDLWYYLILKPEEPEDVWVEFWSTTGEFANKLSSGTTLTTDSLDFKPENIMLMAPTSGGRKGLHSTEKVLAFKSMLLSRDKLITVEDFKAACHALLGNELSHVTIKHGVTVEPDGKSGYSRTIDLWLTLSEQINLTEEEAWAYCQQVKISLQMKAMDFYQLRVFITEQV